MQEPDQENTLPEKPKPVRPFEDDNREDFRIHSKIDILFILRGVMQSNALITLYPDYQNDFILTSILTIDADRNVMVIEYGSNEKICQKALQSSELVFITMQNRVKIEFVCNRINKIQYGGKPAFAVNIPNSLLRIQRRDHFRIATPMIKPLICVIPITENSTATKAEVPLLDISCGGIAVIDQHPIINLDPGTVYKNCQIALPETGTIKTDIEVRSSSEITLRNGESCLRAGCQFINLPASMEAMIQRYIVKQEQKNK